VSVRLLPSNEFSYGELAALFTAAYEGYYVPFEVDEATFGFMVDVFDLDLDESLVAVDGRSPIGLAGPGSAASASSSGGGEKGSVSCSPADCWNGHVQWAPARWCSR
jgi:hypothetical protein